MTGTFSAPTSFGSTTLNPVSGLANVYLVKQSWTGEVLWAKSWGGGADVIVQSIATDSSLNVYIVVITASSSTTFDSFTVGNQGNVDFSVVKIDPTGQVQWAQVSLMS